jgi:hypothetical protein
VGIAGVRFQDAVPDARAVTYARIQADPLVQAMAEALADATPGERLLARAVMNGETFEAEGWRTAFPTLFDATRDDTDRARAERVLAAALAVAERGAGVRDQFRGAVVEAVTELLLTRRAGAAVRRERRILFDGVRAEVHPYDVTVERERAAEAHDCKWGARGINADVLHQLDDARSHATEEGERLTVGLVVFDAARSCHVRLSAQTAPTAGIGLVTLESLDRLAGEPAR